MSDLLQLPAVTAFRIMIYEKSQRHQGTLIEYFNVILITDYIYIYNICGDFFIYKMNS